MPTDKPTVRYEGFLYQSASFASANWAALVAEQIERMQPLVDPG